jgi:threonine dehydrogenase-like Zn-dependent dehydrogenase
MRAAIMNAPFDMKVGTWDKPQPGPKEVLVSVGATGICAGDMYFFQGKNPYAIYPQICGHEIAGLVAGVGENITGFETGQAVVVEPFIGCSQCYPCRIGKSNCCMNLKIIGVHQPGGYADFLTAPAELVHKVPSGLSLPFASFAEPVAIGVQGCRRGEVSEGENILILGCGPIGLALIEVAKARGANITAADVADNRLETAAQFGAETFKVDDNIGIHLKQLHSNEAHQYSKW